MDSADSILDPPFLDLAARDRVVVSGPDALTYLQSQIAQDIRELPVGGAAWTLVLEPNGKVDSLARVTRTRRRGVRVRHRRRLRRGPGGELRRFKIRVAAEIEHVPRRRGRRPAPIERGRADRSRLAEDGRRDRARRDHSGGDRRDRRGGQLHQGLLPGPGARRTDGQPRCRGAVVAAGPHPRVGRPGRHRRGDPVVDASGATIGTVTSVGSTHALATIKRGHDLGTIPAHLG